MTRVKRGMVTKKRHKKLIKKASGYWGQRKNVFKRASETVLRAMAFATQGRKLKKRDMRTLFISRIRAAAIEHGISYNELMHGLKVVKVELNRKMLSQIAVYDPATFSALVSLVKG